MNDTNESVQFKYKSMLMEQASEERLRMGCSMFMAAKEIVRSSIVNQNPKISEQELKKQIFLRFYEHEFTQEKREKILMEL